MSPVCIDQLLCLVHDLDDEGVHADHLLEDGPGQGDGAHRTHLTTVSRKSLTNF